MASLREALSNQETLRIVRTPVIKTKTPVFVIPRVKRSTILKEIFRQRFQKRSVYYFTQGRKLDPSKMRDFSKEKTPYWFPPEEEEFSYKVVYKVWRERFRKQESAYRYFNRPNYRSRQTEDLLERLHIPEEPTDVPKLPGILDIDPDYFSIVTGRPIKDQTDIRTYLTMVQDTLKTRLRTGYVVDNILQLDEQNFDEQDQINSIVVEHKVYLDGFEEFLSKDYHMSMEYLSKLDRCTIVSREKEVVSRELQRDVGLLRSRLYSLEEHWRDCKIYQTFLYKVSPLEWREKYDYINFSKEGRRTSLENSANADVFGRYRLASSGSVASLDALIDMFLLDTKDEPPPLIYFTEPRQLSTIFENMEHRNLNSVLFGEEIRIPLDELQSGLIEYRRKINAEFSLLQDRLHDLEKLIKYEEDRVESLHTLCKDMIYNVFKKMVVSDDSLNMTIFIENAYCDVVNKKDDASKMSLRDMMRSLEITFEGLLLELDYLPNGIVYQSEIFVFEEQKRTMKEAKEAWRKKLLIEGMFSSLSKAFQPVYHRHGRELRPRSDPPPIKKKPPPVEIPLTVEEQYLLDFFTDFCHYTDDFRKFFDALNLGFTISDLEAGVFGGD